MSPKITTMTSQHFQCRQRSDSLIACYGKNEKNGKYTLFKGDVTASYKRYAIQKKIIFFKEIDHQ